MAAGSTYTPIATQTLGGSSSGITFSSIPSTYTDLVLVATGTRGTGGDSIKVRINGDTSASNYSSMILYGTGTSAGGQRIGTLYGYFEDVASWNQTPAPIIFNFNNYSNTTTYKTMMARNNNAGTNVTIYVGLYKSTSAINSIFVNMTDMAAGTTMTLYGITAA